MKKIFILLIAICCTLLFSGCNGCNKTVFDTDYMFTKATYFNGYTWKTVDIVAWNDWDNDNIQIKLKDGTIVLAHSSLIILKSK